MIRLPSMKPKKISISEALENMRKTRDARYKALDIVAKGTKFLGEAAEGIPVIGDPISVIPKFGTVVLESLAKPVSDAGAVVGTMAGQALSNSLALPINTVTHAFNSYAEPWNKLGRHVGLQIRNLRRAFK